MSSTDVELVRCEATDGVVLHGALRAAQREPRTPAAPDAVVCLHGVGGNFYGSRLFDEFADAAAAAGTEVLRVNTRGHDGLTRFTTPDGVKLGGAAYEVVDECRFDIDGWIRFLLERGRRRIGLVGHSLGAIKVAYHESYQPHHAVRCVVAVSPPRLSHSCFITVDSDSTYSRTLESARRLVEQGEGQRLMPVRFPFPMHISAEGYIDKYGPAERYDVTRFVGRMRRPALFTYGSRELSGSIAFAGVPEALAENRRADQMLEVRTVEGADHLYRGRERELSELILKWMETLSG